MDGFVKWDGCTQFTVDFHGDSRQDLEALTSALMHARLLSAQLMPSHYDRRGEYP